MMRRVVVEDSLRNVSDYLRSQGCEVSSLGNESDIDNCDAVVISGQDKNFSGMQDTLTNAVVVDARGRTPEDIYNYINSNLR
ncbi:MAG: YkuS family protein [Firmicutes bacterium]|nr:YkuS family protein [Bacillota bacterium]